MKTVKQACVLRPNALRINVSDQIESLEELIANEGDGVAFFEKTHVTGGMLTLINEGIARLAGRSSQGVFHLKQAMGGGKTHALIVMGLLAKNPALRARYCPNALGEGEFEEARVAVMNGRNDPEHFFWGEIASQLGQEEKFKEFWINGPKAPDEKDWLELFNGDKPKLILLDEMPAYFQYLSTQGAGSGTRADIATRAFANMLSAAGKKRNVCIIVTDLSAAYNTGMQLINKALEDAQGELGRQERTITPVDLSTNEIYDILRKRLFESLPKEDEVRLLADAYEGRLREASKARVAGRGAESIAREIAATYPFHPRLKTIIALFKENENFKQTRGLLEIVSRLLRSVWERQEDDVYLIGAQHFDLGIADVRDKLADISNMRDVIACDLWDEKHGAHAQIVDVEGESDAGSQVGALLFLSSLSTAVSSVRGISKEEMVECLVSPCNKPGDFLDAFDRLERRAWYLHHTLEGKNYFDRQENLTKLLQSLAKDAPPNKVRELIQDRLTKMFHPTRKTVYSEVLPLPTLEEAVDRIRRGRVLLIISPDSKMPPETVQKLFDGLTQKNNLCVLTGERSAMGSVEDSARQLFAVIRAEKEKIHPGHPQRDELETKLGDYEREFRTTTLGLFDKILFPVQLPGQPPQIKNKPLSAGRDTTKPFDGEEQIEQTLTSHPQKLYLGEDKDFDTIRDKAQDLLWPQGHDEARWSDILERAAEHPGIPWLPPRGLERLKDTALSRELWEDLGNGVITKAPKKKKTGAQVIVLKEPDDHGEVVLQVKALNAGVKPRIYYAEDRAVTTESEWLKSDELRTRALRVNFLAVDMTGQCETGEGVEWKNKIVLRSDLSDDRKLTLIASPCGDIRYSLDGSEPRDGTVYTGPIDLGKGEVRVLFIAEQDGIEGRGDRLVGAAGKEGVVLDDAKPVSYETRRGVYTMPDRKTIFEGIQYAVERGGVFEGLTMSISEGSESIHVSIKGLNAGKAALIEAVLKKSMEGLGAEASVTVDFHKVTFQTGYDFKEFAQKTGLTFKQEEVSQ